MHSLLNCLLLPRPIPVPTVHLPHVAPLLHISSESNEGKARWSEATTVGRSEEIVALAHRITHHTTIVDNGRYERRK